MMRCFVVFRVTHHTSFTRFCLSGQKQHTHYELEVTINYSFRKLATLTIDTLSLGLSTKTYTDVIQHTKLNFSVDIVTYMRSYCCILFLLGLYTFMNFVHSCV